MVHISMTILSISQRLEIHSGNVLFTKMITERDHNKIWITPNVINELGRNLLRDIHLGIEKVEVEHIQGNDVTPSTPIDDNASFRYDSHDGKEMSVLKMNSIRHLKLYKMLFPIT